MNSVRVYRATKQKHVSPRTGEKNWADGGVGLSTRCLQLWGWKTAQSKQQPRAHSGRAWVPGKGRRAGGGSFPEEGALDWGLAGE